MKQAFAPFFPHGTRPVAALAAPSQAEPFLRDAGVPGARIHTPYRIEHPHSALARRAEALERQDTLYTPTGRLTAKYARSGPDEPWQRRSSFVRRSSQLGALASFCQDMQAAALPAPEEGWEGWLWMLPSPFARLCREWVDEGLISAITKSGEARPCLKALDALYREEATRCAPCRPTAAVMDEGLTADMAQNPLWRKHAARAAAQLSALPEAPALAVTSDDETLTGDMLPFPALILYRSRPITPESWQQEADRLAPCLASGGAVLLSPCAGALYPPLIRRLLGEE